MGRRLGLIGGIVTLLYLAGLTWLLWGRLGNLSTMGLNEVGDFLAGAFGPVAFLWLVLGFLQQGKELRVSSEALQLQANELKNSVEQQTLMASAATEQMKSQQAAFELQLWKHEQSISPDFNVYSYLRSGPYADRKTMSCIRIVNKGASVDAVSVLFDPPIGECERISILGVGGVDGISNDVDFSYMAPSEEINGTCCIEYLRSDGELCSKVFTYLLSPDGCVSINKVVPLARS